MTYIHLFTENVVSQGFTACALLAADLSVHYLRPNIFVLCLRKMQ